MNIYNLSLDYLEMIDLRNHIGNSYIIAEEIQCCDAEKQFDIQKRILPRSNKKGIVPVINLNVFSKEKAHSKFKSVSDICKSNNIQLMDVYYDADKNKMLLFLEAYVLD